MGDDGFVMVGKFYGFFFWKFGGFDASWAGNSIDVQFIVFCTDHKYI